MSIDYIRKQIKELNVERENATLEKGLAAQDNKDLRENAEYDYWVEQEMKLTIKIGNLLQEIARLTKTTVKIIPQKNSKKTKQSKVVKISELPKNKWL